MTDYMPQVGDVLFIEETEYNEKRIVMVVSFLREKDWPDDDDIFITYVDTHNGDVSKFRNWFLRENGTLISRLSDEL